MANIQLTPDDETEAVALTPTDPLYTAFEKAVAETLEQLDPKAEVQHNVFVEGTVSGTRRQIDVLVIGEIVGQKVTIAIECKRYKKKLGIDVVDQFVGRLVDFGVDLGVLYSVNGVTPAAAARAANSKLPRITLMELNESDLSVPDVLQLLSISPKFGDCSNSNCATGDVSWREWPQTGGTIIEAGQCTSCGGWSVRCSDPICAEKNEVFTDSFDCYSCGLSYQFIYDRDRAGVEDIIGGAGIGAAAGLSDSQK